MELTYLFQVRNIAIRYLYTLQNDHHDKSSYHPSLHKDIALLLTRFPVLYITSPWLVCFITGSRYFLISFTYRTQSSTPLPSGNHQFVLRIYDSVSVLSAPFFFFFRFHMQVWSYGLSLCLTYFTQYDSLKVHPCLCKWQDFILFYGLVVCVYIHTLHVKVIFFFFF